ncbi:MAG: hypothetical protein HUU20_23255 [Pirellulales bacterium]|nr:hypothetical protein [Pirellulales bacterium]
MTENGSNQSEPRSPRRRFQFGMATLLIAAIPVSLLAAALGGMLGQSAGRPLMPAAFFVVLSIATPLGLVIAVSLVRLVIAWWKQSGR